ncbi:zinc dependent phospholipase C family protein [Mucilaginibacter sp. PAMB04274]|uniref:zinc dependent phospholipase C family protein n=1 Tax=Mucilaginibacter sp. PAMB04274 TaxID=3138568 RepID=UPI0031F6546E
MRFKRYFISCCLLLLAILSCPRPGKAFSILAHEAIIDAEWDLALKPILVKRYPNATLDELIKAHSYAYGGSLVADIGYMPGGNAYFTDLLHYVRSGEFITNLLGEARDLNEYAFALGAMSHYIADQYGHSMATNVTVPELYPDLKRKFGNVVTYEEDHTSHSRMEFAYDVVQVGRSNYASVAYHDFIGFNITPYPLERAFLKTYGQHLNVVVPNFKTSIGRMRWGVKNLFPALTKAAWNAKKDDIVKANEKATKRSFRYKMSKRMYTTEFGSKDNKPDFTSRAVAFLVRILPKVGPLKNLKFVYPGLEGEKRFVQVFDTIINKYHVALTDWDNNRLKLKDINLDVGAELACGQYMLADKTHCELVTNLHKEQFSCLSEDIQAHLTSYFNGVGLHELYKSHPEDEGAMHMALREMKKHSAVADNLSGLDASVKVSSVTSQKTIAGIK